jgi:transcriptional regulator with XRE-family HTH domain
MKNANLIRNAHFLGTKIRNLRKRNNLTMEDLSARCMKINTHASPSVSYLSMIERGKRHPSEEMLEVIASVFQKDVGWFLNDSPKLEDTVPDKGGKGGISGIALEPSFLFTNEILQIAIPELLSQAGVSGRQFAHLLIRAHQENHQNRFPELERAAEEVGQKRMPLDLQDVLSICNDLGLKIHWFTQLGKRQLERLGVREDTFVRSYFEASDTIHVNRALQEQPARLKYDLAVHIGHYVLHGGDGIKSPMVAHRKRSTADLASAFDAHSERDLKAQDMVHAWRDFECSFFAGALLCPRIPFRRLIERSAHEVTVGKGIEVSTSVVMRRMTAVSSYPHWHYFDAYPPGKLNAVYRGNGIPLPWGNMRLVQDPCQHWAVFRMLNTRHAGTSAQISLLDVGNETRLYCCESLKVKNVTHTEQVLCAGIDINPAIEAQGLDAAELAEELKRACLRKGGMAKIPKSIKQNLTSVARILNIGWLERGIEKDARLICPRSGACPRKPTCEGVC